MDMQEAVSIIENAVYNAVIASLMPDEAAVKLTSGLVSVANKHGISSKTIYNILTDYAKELNNEQD